MRILSRYLLRQLAAPFTFALVALTSLMILSQIAKKFGSLVGKGLPWSVIAEVFALSVPFIVAMTLPMAVLIAVLYTFSHLAADNEITAMRANGISVYQILAPVFVWGVGMGFFNLVFVDQVLPRSNARLRSLLIDIGRKKPTFELREQVINEIPPSQYFLRAGRIDAATGRLKDVTIYDVGGEASRRVIYADSGLMAYAEGQTDLSLRLFDGSVHSYRPAEPMTFQLTYYRVNDIRVKNVFDELQRNSTDAVRGDREMGTCEMLAIIHDARVERAEAQARRRELLLGDLRTLVALPPLPAADSTTRAPGLPRYCKWIEAGKRLLFPTAAEAQTAAQARSPGVRLRDEAPSVKPQISTWSQVSGAVERAQEANRQAARFSVEVHKKWAISTACISFVIIGIVMALRFPRGGIGLVIGGGLLIFSIHYVGLTAGESLADRGFLSPWLAMWAPNIVLTALGLVGLVRVSRESGSTRGGDLQEVVDAIRSLFRRRRFALKG